MAAVRMGRDVRKATSVYANMRLAAANSAERYQQASCGSCRRHTKKLCGLTLCVGYRNCRLMGRYFAGAAVQAARRWLSVLLHMDRGGPPDAAVQLGTAGASARVLQLQMGIDLC